MRKITNAFIKERFFERDGETHSRYGLRKEKIEWIVIHYTGEARADGIGRKCACNYQTSRRSVSAHYVVGDDGIFKTLDEEKQIGWHCAVKDCTPKCGARNSNSIGIDLVEQKCDIYSCSVKDNDWHFSDQVFDEGAQLVAYLAKKYKIPSDHIVRHFDVTGKWCPRPFVGDDMNSAYGKTGNWMWQAFKARVERHMILNDVSDQLCEDSNL